VGWCAGSIYVHIRDVYGNTAFNGDPRLFTVDAALPDQAVEEVMNGAAVRSE
jgi:hypothetical protein